MSMQANGFNPDELKPPSGSFLGGQYVPGDGTEYEVIRPSDGHLIRVERGASANLVDRAVTAAAKAFKTSGWASLAPRERAKVLFRWADLLEKHLEEIARFESLASCRLINETRHFDIGFTADVIRFFAEAIDKLAGQVLASEANVMSMVVHEPYGVVAAISPWNVPLVLAVLKLAPALAAGNAVVLKPSELTPYSILRVAELAHQAGVPAGQLAVLPGLGPETGSALVRHPLVNYVSFTGSTATGKQVMIDAANTGLKPVCLELGGKSPQLVFGDAPSLDRVADAIAGSICFNAGQVCFAGTRLVVDEKIGDELTEKIAQRLKNPKSGPTWDTRTTLSPIISAKQGIRIADILRDAKKAGAEIMMGGEREETGNGGVFFKPTIVRNPKPDNAVILNEVFGPVLAVQTFSDVEEGIALADHPIYGLAGAVHTNDINKALLAAKSIPAGTVWVNTFAELSLNAPFGGYKQSGFGRDYGMTGLSKYMNTKTIHIRLN
jgi:aldehyde dehydrogenase (NAD+)